VPLLALILIFVAVPLVELYVIIEVVGPAIGAPLTILLLAADSLAGAWLMKSQGRAVWRRFNETLRAGGIPHREIVDGALVIFGGAFLITPGFLTDILGFALLFPPTRALVRRTLQRRLERRAVFASSDDIRVRRDYDVEGTATERQDPEFELPPRSGRRGRTYRR
jgi:UPF0716 protein FxsA